MFQIKEKKVSFNEKFNEIYYIDADKESRKGPWEQYARDTARFKKKIKEEFEIPLTEILNIDHRKRIYDKILNSSS